MDVGVGYFGAYDELALKDDGGVILVTVESLLVFLRPTSIQVLVAETLGIIVPALRQLAALDAFVFLAAVALARNFNKRRIYDVTFAGDQALLF